MKEKNTVSVSLVYGGLYILQSKIVEGIHKGDKVIISFSYPNINISKDELETLRKLVLGFYSFSYAHRFFELRTKNQYSSLRVFCKEFGINPLNVSTLINKRIITELTNKFKYKGGIKMELNYYCNLQIQHSRKVLFEKTFKYKLIRKKDSPFKNE